MRVSSVPPGDLDDALIATEILRARDVDIAGARIDGDVLGPIERRGTEAIRRLAAAQHDVALRREAAFSGVSSRMRAVHERQPLAAAVVEKPRDVQRAVVEQVAVRLAAVPDRNGRRLTNL